MNIREGMGIKTLQGDKGTITKVEMQVIMVKSGTTFALSHMILVTDLVIILVSVLNGTVLKKICINTLSLLVARIYKRLV